MSGHVRSAVVHLLTLTAMRILSLSPTPLASIPYANAGHDGRAYRAVLPVLCGTVDRLPQGVEALVVTGDLQGRQWEGLAEGRARLIGEVLPEALRPVLEAHGLPACSAAGAVVAGDMFTTPTSTKRGGTGDVLPVWEAFGAAFAWVIGVMGNHDLLGTDTEPPGWMRRSPRVRCIVQGSEDRGGVVFGGLSGIIGNPRKPNGHAEEEYVGKLLDLLALGPEVLVMHDGPDAPGTDLRGKVSIREALDVAPPSAPSLVIRAHCHWVTPLVELAAGRQVLNVEGRLVILTR